MAGTAPEPRAGAVAASSLIRFAGMVTKRFFITSMMIGVFGCGGSQSTGTTPPAGDDGGGEVAPAGDGEPTAAGDRKKPDDAGQFQINETDKSARPKQAKLQATDKEAALRFFVVDTDKGPIPGIVVSLTSPSGKAYYTEQTDSEGFAEVLVPIGQTYELVYLSLGRRNVAAKVEVKNEPRTNLKLTMRYKKEEYPSGLVLDVQFATGKATITSDSFARLDSVVEYMTHKKAVKIEIAGHTDNVGKKAANKKLSQQRANAVRDYLVSKGVDADRVKAVGYGDAKPIAPNDNEEGRQANRRIEATELTE